MAKDIQTPKKQEDLWREVLYSSDFDAIKELLKHLREKGNPQIIPDIVKIFKGYKNTELETSIFEFLMDLKCKEAVDILIPFLKDNEFIDIRRDLLIICWETGLDFSNYLDVFVDVFISSSLKTSFEAFTVIEYLENVSRTDIKNNIEKLQLSVSDVGVEKKELLVDLVQVLRSKL